MKKTKSKILLIKLAVLCAITFGLFYAKPAEVNGAGMCETCVNNCDDEYLQCLRSFWTILFEDQGTCRNDRVSCKQNCGTVVCTIATTESGV